MSTGGSRVLEVGYERFFGFSEAPFSLAPNTRFLFDGASHASALTQVTYALERREPVVVVTGEIGTGKTLLCRTVVERLERKTFLSIIDDPLLDRDDLLKQMLQDFGVISKDRTKMTLVSRHELIHALQQFLSSLTALQAHTVLIIDEAQHVQPDVLEQIRLVSNIHDERGTMLQIILVGQTDLESVLSRPELRQLRQRVSRHVRLEPLDPAEVAQYIEHRLAVGHKGRAEPQTSDALEPGRMTVAFTSEASTAVSRLSRGLPRVINLLCDRALETAYAQQVRTIDASLISTAARALDLPDAPEPVLAQLAEQSVEAASPAFAPAAPKEVGPRPAARRFMLAAAAVGAVAALWFLGRTVITPARNGEPSSTKTASRETNTVAAPSVTTPAPEKVASAPAPASDAPSVTAPGTAATAAPVTSAESSAAGFEIVVASFHTEGRATAVADEIIALGLPVRQRVAGGWRQVLAGPFTSRDLAEAAQDRVDRAGFGGTQIVPIAR